ncbi:hypothetical protein D3C84_804440 [compost metagenome]
MDRFRGWRKLFIEDMEIIGTLITHYDLTIFSQEKNAPIFQNQAALNRCGSPGFKLLPAFALIKGANSVTPQTKRHRGAFTHNDTKKCPGIWLIDRLISPITEAAEKQALLAYDQVLPSERSTTVVVKRSRVEILRLQ